MSDTRASSERPPSRRLPPRVPLPPRRRHTFLVMPAALCALLLAAAPAAGAQQRPETPVVVPDLAGHTLAEAREMLAAVKLLLVGVDTVLVTDDVGVGGIARQKPRAGERVRPGTGVTVELRLRGRSPDVRLHGRRPDLRAVPPDQDRRIEPRGVTVPDLLGGRLDRAAAALERVGLAIGDVAERDEVTVPAGLVLDQHPPAGTGTRPGARVAVLIASDATIVPDLRGMTAQEVRGALAARRLVLGSAERVPSDATTGTVMAQRPEPGTRVVKESPVDVAVAVPQPRPVLAIVPDVVGGHVERTRATLGRHELRLGAVVWSDDARGKAGEVREQRPAAGSEVPPGTAIDVVVATDSATVPRLQGLTLERAHDRARAAGFTLDRPVTVMSDAPEGTIVAQRPGEGVRMPKRSAVAVGVATPVLLEVPALTGRSIDQAVAALGAAGLGAGRVTTRVVAGVAERVIGQTPGAGTLVRRGTSIDLEVSVAPPPPPPPPRQRPPVTPPGQTPPATPSRILPSPQTPPEAQTPPQIAPSRQSPAGATPPAQPPMAPAQVPDSVKVPDVVGLSAIDAAVALGRLRLRVGVVDTAVSAAGTGAVSAQRTPAGARVPVDAPIDLVVAVAAPAAPAPTDAIAVPDVVGMSESAARARLADVGLVLVRRSGVRAEGRADGTVAAQTPPAGAALAPGGAVQVDVVTAALPVAPAAAIAIGVLAAGVLLFRLRRPPHRVRARHGTDGRDGAREDADDLPHPVAAVPIGAIPRVRLRSAERITDDRSLVWIGESNLSGARTGLDYETALVAGGEDD